LEAHSGFFNAKKPTLGSHYIFRNGIVAQFEEKLMIYTISCYFIVQLFKSWLKPITHSVGPCIPAFKGGVIAIHTRRALAMKLQHNVIPFNILD